MTRGQNGKDQQTERQEFHLLTMKQLHQSSVSALTIRRHQNPPRSHPNRTKLSYVETGSAQNEGRTESEEARVFIGIKAMPDALVHL